MKSKIRLIHFMAFYTALISVVQAQTVRVVRPGSYNLPISKVRLTYNGNTITQTSEASGTTAHTSLAVNLVHVKVNDNGTTRTLAFINSIGAQIRNNNFSGSTTGVGLWNTGTSTLASNISAWENAMVSYATSPNLLEYLYYDGTVNAPSGDDFDLLYTKGWTSEDILLVGERDGNTYFSLVPLDSTGAAISGAYKL